MRKFWLFIALFVACLGIGYLIFTIFGAPGMAPLGGKDPTVTEKPEEKPEEVEPKPEEPKPEEPKAEDIVVTVKSPKPVMMWMDGEKIKKPAKNKKFKVAPGESHTLKIKIGKKTVEKEFEAKAGKNLMAKVNPKNKKVSIKPAK